MLSYFNVELIRSVNASSNFLQHCTSSYGQSTRLGGETNTIRYRDSIITRSVICLIALFILCQVPASILNYIYMYHRNHPLLYICYDISNFLILLNSAVRFAIVSSLASFNYRSIFLFRWTSSYSLVSIGSFVENWVACVFIRKLERIYFFARRAIHRWNEQVRISVCL